MEELTHKPLQCVVVTPEKALLDETVDAVVLPMFDGELGVLPGRAPMIGRLGCGELRTQRGTQTHRYFIDSGFAQVRSNVVTVLTARAIKAEDINVEAAKNELQKAHPVLVTEEARVADQKARERAR